MKKLLVITQKVNKNDSNLGFFHEWLLRLAGKVERLTVICLEKGEYDLPSNVRVLSLGKEEMKLLNCYVVKLLYCWRFYKYIWRERRNYDGVFAHMNPEYCILGGILWRVWKKRILLWYTHKSVNWQLWMAEKFVDKIFTASKESFRLPSKKVEVVGHGIPVEKFIDPDFKYLEKLRGNSLFLMSVGRITPSKDWETVILAMAELQNKKLPGLDSMFFLVVGAPITQEDIKYGNRLKEISRSKANMAFTYSTYPWETELGGMPYVYQGQHLLIHTSRTGSMDKVVLEALAAGRVVVTSSEAYTNLAEGELKDVVYSFPAGDYKELAKIIEKIYHSGILNKLPIQPGIDYVSEKHNLDNVINKISNYFVCKNCQ